VPWCDDCERFSNPNSLGEDGGCPSCGAVIAEPREPDVDDDARSRTSVPWHFWLLLVAVVVYLGWRLVQGVAWLAGRF
jgi:hypothetical protein